MITDRIENAERYHSLHPRFRAALDFLARPDLAGLKDGRYPIDGDAVYALVQSYTTEPAHTRRWESHRRYVDIQYVDRGVESMGWAPAGELVVSQPYAEDKDVVFYGETKDATAIRLDGGTFCILFPSDAHKPGCARDTPARVRKIVLKVLL